MTSVSLVNRGPGGCFSIKTPSSQCSYFHHLYNGNPYTIYLERRLFIKKQWPVCDWSDLVSGDQWWWCPFSNHGTAQGSNHKRPHYVRLQRKSNSIVDEAGSWRCPDRWGPRTNAGWAGNHCRSRNLVSQSTGSCVRRHHCTAPLWL